MKYRRAALHFLLLGALLFAADHLLAARSSPASAVRPRIVLSADDVAALRREAVARSGRMPDGEQLAELIETTVDEEILYREALARGLADGDAVVQRRLVQNLRFVDAAPDADDAALLRQARALALERSDAVVRRRLAQQMRLRLEAEPFDAEPTDAQLAAYLAEHRARFALPARVHLTHIFFDPERRGARAEADARELISELTGRSSEIRTTEAQRTQRKTPSGTFPVGPVTNSTMPSDPGGMACPSCTSSLCPLYLCGESLLSGQLDGCDEVTHTSDPFPVAADLPLQAQEDLARLFGRAFARDAMALPPHRWSGPLRSAYGVHVVCVRERLAGGMPSLAAVRDAVRGALRAERANRTVRDALASLRGKYEVVVEPR